MRDCTAYLVYKGGVNFIDSVPDYVLPSTRDTLKIVGSTPVKTPSNKRKTVSTNRIITKRRRRTETDSVSVFRSRFPERQTRNSKREKCRLSLDKVLKQYRSSNRSKNINKSSDNKISVPLKMLRSTDVSSLDACTYDNFVAGNYSTETPEGDDNAFVSNVDHLLSLETVEKTSVLPQSNADSSVLHLNVDNNKEDFNIENNSSVLDATEVHATDDLNVDNNSSVLDLNSVENTSVLDGTEVPGKEDYNIYNNSSVLEATEVHATDDLNIDNNTVLPQAEGYQDQSTHNEVDIESRDKGDSTPNGNDIDVPDKGDSTPNGNNMDVPDKGDSTPKGNNMDVPDKGDSTPNGNNTDVPDKGDSTPKENNTDVPDKGDSTPKGNNTDLPDKGNSNFNKQDISKEENLLQITKKWNLPLMTVSLTDLDTTIKNELAKKGMIRDI